MKSLEAELVKIVEHSSTMAERLGSNFFSSISSESDDRVRSKIESWCQIVTKGDLENFQKRLAWDDLNLSTVRPAFGSVRLRDAQNLPPWVETFKAGIEASALISVETLLKGAANEYPCLEPQNPIPFEEVFLSFIQVGRQKLISKAGESYHCLSAVAHANLERNLLGSLARLYSHTMELKFSVFRAQRQSPLSRILGQLQNTHPKHHYQAFIKEMLKGGGLLTFFQEYPVLARLVATVTDFWVDASQEFLQRLTSDWSTIEQTFQADRELGEIVSIQPSLSDPHNNRRSVIAVTFSSGLKLIYKPKDLGLEAAYFQLLTWLNQQGISLPFKLLKVLNRSSYGWVEFVEYLPCQDKEEVKRYYQRAGQLLCLLYILGANDCHNENLIACGEHPVVVDLETLMHPQFREIAGLGEGAEALSLAHQQLGDSVLRTGLLPRWEVGSDGREAYDVSGLGGVGEQETSYRLPKWENINTDNMSLGHESARIVPQDNAPSLEGVTLSANDYVEELVDGFEQMYRFFVAQREAFLATDGPLTALAHQEVRCVFRPTQVYASVLQKSLQPQCLRDGADRSIELDVLSRVLLWSESKHPFWSLLKAELQALEQMDIPYFTAYSDSDALSVSSDETIEQCFAQPSYNQVIARLQRLSDEDLAQQIAIIRSSFYSMVASEPNHPPLAKNVELNLDAVSPLTQDVMVQQAVAIAQDLQQRAIRAADGSATWIGLEFLPQAKRFQLQPIGYNLYDGNCGIALFLAAVTKVTGDTRFRDLSLGALQPLRKILLHFDSESGQEITNLIAIGGAVGLGSIVYALVQISQFLDEATLLEDAKRAASLISPAAIAADQLFDIMAGAAGAILGLLALHEVTADPAVLEQAATCGHHLLNHRLTSDTGFRSWAIPDEKPLTGFSHGAAGIAYALLRLYETTQDAAFLEAAQEAIAYERSVFSPTAGNWPDLRSLINKNNQPSFMTTWCHGATGIGLARLGSLAILDTPEIHGEIAIALNTTLKFGLQDIDHPCCGNCGRIELLLVAAQKLSRPELVETAQKQAAWVVARAKQAGTFHLFPNLPKDVYNPGFFQGTAGIGYQLLRLAYPNILPSVLLWDSNHKREHPVFAKVPGD